MRYRQITDSGDYSWGHSLQDFYIDTPAAVAQAVKTRLLLWQGEWYLDIDEGTPYMTGILGKHSQAEADFTVQARITGTQGLVDIAKYDSVLLGPPTRAYSMTTTIDTIYGLTQVQIQNFVNY